jgi:purine-binding chemotaxis protein CheW
MLEELRRQLEIKLATQANEEQAPIFAGKQFLIFKVADQELLIAVDDVREIVMPPPITFVPRAKKELEGVFALRGEIMPVVNLRRLLGFSQGTLSSTTRCLVVSPSGDNFAIIVDELTEFVWLVDDEIDSAAQEYLSDDFCIVSGVAKNSGTVRPVVDVKLVLQLVFERGHLDEQVAN